MKRLSDEKIELALSLLKCGKSYREITDALDISIASVHRISKEPIEDILPLIKEIGGRLYAKNLLLADYILSSMSNENILRASLKDKAVAAAVLTDKAVRLKILQESHQPHCNDCNTQPQVEHIDK